MNQEYEIIHYPKIKHVNIFIDEITYRSQHLHSDYEFCFCLSGHAKFISLHKIIEANKGDIVFFDSKEVHSIESHNEPLIGMFVQISSLFLKEYFPELSSRTYLNTNLNNFINKKDIENLFKKFIFSSIKYFQETENYKFDTLDSIVNLLNLTFSNVEFLNVNEKTIINRRKDVERLQRITNYIDLHFQDNVSLKDIAKNEGITTTHLSHLFSDRLGITYQQYLNERRFECAVQLMNNSNKKIIEVSYASGFSDPKYLTKMCKIHFNMTPLQYKKREGVNKITNTDKNQFVLERIYTNEEALKFLKHLRK